MSILAVVSAVPFVNGKCRDGADHPPPAANTPPEPQGRPGTPLAPRRRGKPRTNGVAAHALANGRDPVKSERAAPHGSPPFAAHASRILELGYSPLPIEPGAKRPAAVLHGGSAEWQPWSDYCETPLAEGGIGVLASMAPYGLGVACGYGGLVAIDIDTDTPEIVAAIEAVLPVCVVASAGGRARRGFSAIQLGRSPRGRSRP